MALSYPDQIREAAEAIRHAQRVLVFTGAGVSAESGIPTFRDAQVGLWERFSPEELASPRAFLKDPALVWRWYRERQLGVLQCHPNPAHHAIAAFQQQNPDVVVVTQNVDGFHQRALAQRLDPVACGSGDADRTQEIGARILALHGDILSVRCFHCDYTAPWQEAPAPGEAAPVPSCPACDGWLRPAVVWFGEALDGPTLEQAMDAARSAEVCLVVGTEAVVYPAAAIPEITLGAGGKVIEVNPSLTPLSPMAHVSIRGRAGQVLPELLKGKDEGSP